MCPFDSKQVVLPEVPRSSKVASSSEVPPSREDSLSPSREDSLPPKSEKEGEDLNEPRAAKFVQHSF